MIFFLITGSYCKRDDTVRGSTAKVCDLMEKFFFPKEKYKERFYFHAFKMLLNKN